MYLCGRAGHNPWVRLMGPRALLIIGVILVASVVGIGVLVVDTSPKAPLAHFAVARYVPPVPRGVAMGVPLRGFDPGFSGGVTQVVGKVGLCASQQAKRPWVALVRGGRVATGQTVSADGGFALSIHVPDRVVSRIVYTLVSSTGASAPVELAWGSTTYFVWTGDCAVPGLTSGGLPRSA